MFRFKLRTATIAVRRTSDGKTRGWAVQSRADATCKGCCHPPLAPYKKQSGNSPLPPQCLVKNTGDERPEDYSAELQTPKAVLESHTDDGNPRRKYAVR